MREKDKCMHATLWREGTSCKKIGTSCAVYHLNNHNVVGSQTLYRSSLTSLTTSFVGDY